MYLALCLLTSLQLSCVYNDHSLYTWDLRHIRHIGKLHSFLYHSAAIWDIDVRTPERGEGRWEEEGLHKKCWL